MVNHMVQCMTPRWPTPAAVSPDSQVEVESPVSQVEVESPVSLISNITCAVPNIITCSVCKVFQSCPPPDIAAEVRFCLTDWPEVKCEVCCGCGACTKAYEKKFQGSDPYKCMMNIAVRYYVTKPISEFALLSSIDLEG